MTVKGKIVARTMMCCMVEEEEGAVIRTVFCTFHTQLGFKVVKGETLSGCLFIEGNCLKKNATNEVRGLWVHLKLAPKFGGVVHMT